MQIPTLTALLLPFIAATPLTPKTFTASAPAKLILFGEHAVTVQNNTALALALPLRLYKSTNGTVTHTEIPQGAGLGSSAAYAVATALSEHITTPSEITKRVNELEEIANGKRVSGVDGWIVQYGGCGSFQNSGEKKKFVLKPTRLIVIYTGISRSTKAVLATLKPKRHPNEIYKDMESVTQEFMRTQDWTLTRKAHAYLHELGVSHPRWEEILAVGKRHQLLNGKITGGGRGGCGFVAITNESEANITDFKNEVQGLDENIRIWDIISSEEIGGRIEKA